MPFTRQQRYVHTLPFAFRPPQEDDESVKMSKTTSGRSSAPSSALPASHPCASGHPSSIVILLALRQFSEGPARSDFAKGRPAPLPHAGPAAAGIFPSFSVPSAFLRALCVKSLAFLSTLCSQNHQFLLNTNEPLLNFATRTKQTTSFFLFHAKECLSRASSLAIHTKQTTSSQITALFLFDTNERSQITNHQSLPTDFLTR